MSADRFKDRLAKMGLDAAPFSEEDLTAKYEQRKSGAIVSQSAHQVDSLNSNRAVVYLSTVPLDMRPSEVRLHFNEYGTIMRQKFIPYPKKMNQSGKSLKSLQFKEGYLEFENKKDAEKAIIGLNGKMVAVKRFRKAHGQTWNCKLLPKFSWDTLLEKKEKELRELKFKEHKAKDEERQINETYRKMVAMKKQRVDLLAKSRREERENEGEEDISEEEEGSDGQQCEEEVVVPAPTPKRKAARTTVATPANNEEAPSSPSSAKKALSPLAAKKLLALRQKRAREATQE